MKQIPYFANLEDGTHCYQAALKMVLSYFYNKDWSFKELDCITGKLPGKWTWPTASLLWLLDHQFEVRLIETFDYNAFAKRGKDYLAEKYGDEVAEAQNQNSDLAREQKLAEKFAQKNCVTQRTPEWHDLECLFKDKYLIICNINACLIHNRKGYSGHFVVPLKVSGSSIVLHDPGLPPLPSITVTKELFEAAWGYPSEEAKNILAIRKTGANPLK